MSSGTVVNLALLLARSCQISSDLCTEDGPQVQIMCKGSYMHTHMDACTHTWTHAHTHGRMHTHMDACTHTWTHAHTHGHMHTHMDACTHAPMHKRTHTHTHTVHTLSGTHVQGAQWTICTQYSTRMCQINNLYCEQTATIAPWALPKTPTPSTVHSSGNEDFHVLYFSAYVTYSSCHYMGSTYCA